MRSAAVALLIGLAIATTTNTARAECTLAHTDPPCLSPWLDQGAVLPVGVVEPPPDHRWRAAAVVGGLYLGFSAWAYLAWYRNVPALRSFAIASDGFFGRNTYAGGADKLGHAWANLVLSRATTGVLRWGGWGRTSSAITGSALSWALFLAVEVKDGYYYKFSPGDTLMNTTGAVLAAVMGIYPRLDELIDFRVEYWFSDEYLGLWRGEYHGSHKGNSLNIAEDYSGETYFLALHLGALPRPAALPSALATALDYVDVGVGFQTRKYKPDADADAVPTQEVFFGATIDLQRVVDRALRGHGSRAARTTRAVGRNVLEFLSPPSTILPIVGAKRHATGPAPEQ